MTFLPMVQRELRVLARKPATYRWRWLIGGAAFGMALLLVMMMGLMGSPKGWGEALFRILSGYAAAVCLLAGLFGAADILSEERREGTLGLLFLTDLKGYDVVLGKFSAVALNAFYWLLAIIPVLSLPLLMGGVTFGEFARTSLALINLLFFSMAVGTWASARVIEVMHSLSISAAVLVFFGIITPVFFSFAIFAGVDAQWAWVTCSPILSLLSTGSMKYAATPQLYWYPFLSSSMLSCLLLGLAGWQLPKIWQKPVKEPGSWMSTRLGGKRQSTSFSARVKWLDVNPAMFVMRPGKGVRTTAVVLLVLGTVMLLVDTFYFDEYSLLFVPFTGSPLEWFLLLPLKLVLVIHACSFFASARQSGAFELLLSTPLTIKEIVQAHWKVINRTFLWPYFFLVVYVMYGGVKMAIVSHPGSTFEFGGIGGLLMIGKQVVAHVFDYILLGWMGAWMCLKLKRPGWAPFFTILFALVLPSFLCGIGFLFKPVLIAVARHYVTYELPRLVRSQFDSSFKTETPVMSTVPPPLN